MVDGITFTGCEFTDNGDCGLIVKGSGAKNWSVTGGHFGGNTNSGIRAAGGTTVYKAAGTGAIGDIEEGALYLATIGVSAPGTAAASLQGGFRLRFLDG